MPRYVITEKAGRFVAGHRNTGVGTALELPPHAAEYEIRLGTLVPAGLPPPAAEAEEHEPALTDQASGLTDQAAGLTDSARQDADAPAAAGKRKRRK